MQAWATFWGIILIVVLVVFASLAVAVAIGGFFDFKALFKSMDEQHASNEEAKHPEG